MTEPDPDAEEKFSVQLQAWVDGKQPKTVASLFETFLSDGIAVVIVVLMAVPALPVPTGGVTHVFEVVVVLLAAGLVVGRNKPVRLPKKWQDRSVEGLAKSKGMRLLIRLIAWFEKYSRPRGRAMLESRWFGSVAGVLIVLLTVTAFVAPPFSGLDTLPALGAVLIALSLILRDIVVFAVGCVLGAAGAALTFTLGAEVFHKLF
jgi:hypothetical protein